MAGSEPRDDTGRDTDEFAFTRHGPWTVEPERLRWKAGIDRIRARTRAEVPGLLATHRLPPLARLVRSVAGLARAVGVWYVRERGTPASRRGLSWRLRRSFEHLGSTYVKLGQIVSAFEGLFPDDLVLEFKKLRDQGQSETAAATQARERRLKGLKD